MTKDEESSPVLGEPSSPILETNKDNEEVSDYCSDSSNDDDNGNSYEEERKRNIERNKMLLANLGLEKGLVPKSAPTEPKKKSRRSVDSDSIGTRRSSRLSTKPKLTYNYNQLEREQNKLKRELEQQEKAKKRRNQGKRIMSESEMATSDEDSDGGYDGKPFGYYKKSRRSGRLQKKTKFDYAKLFAEEEAEIEDLESGYDSFEHVKVVEPTDSDHHTEPESEIESPIITFSKNIPESEQKKFHKTIAKLGGAIDDAYNMATHLICNSDQKRTLSLMCAIIRGIHIVTTDWLESCRENIKFVKEDAFTIETLREPIKLAREKRIFAGCNFLLDKSAKDVDILNILVEAGEGNILPSLREVSKQVEDGLDINTLYIIADDVESLQEFKTESKLPITVFRTSEFVKASAMKQILEDDNLLFAD